MSSIPSSSRRVVSVSIVTATACAMSSGSTCACTKDTNISGSRVPA